MASSSRDAPGPMRVSVCIPSLGRPSLWERAVPSLLALGDDVDEVVVAFHGEEAAARAELPNHPKLVVVTSDALAVGAVRNAAVAASSGDLIAFLDDDDEAAPGGLALLHRLIEEPSDPPVGFASGAMEVCDGEGVAQREWPPEDQGGLYEGMVALFHAGSFLVRREVFERAGGYREELRHGENYDLGLRIAALVAEGRWTSSATDEVVMRWIGGPRDYGTAQAESASFVLDTYRDLLDRHPDERAKLHAIVAVQRWRAGERRAARRHFVDAVRASPTDRNHWARLALSCVPPLAERRWPRTAP